MASELLTGWARTSPSAAEVLRPSSADEVVDILGAAGRRGVIARGLGRGYGDCAQNAGGRVIDMTAVAGRLDLDPDTGLATVGGGRSIDEVIRAFLARGWFVPVTPGTRQVTMGGAVAADVHGKNHHRDGSLTAHVSGLRLATPVGVEELSAGDDLFDATAGGMGLTGVVLEVDLQMTPVQSAYMAVDTRRTTDLDETMALMAADDHRYSVAWIDCLSTGRRMGRSVITSGEHARTDQLPPGLRSDPLRFRTSGPVPSPPWAPSGLLNRASIAAFNEAWFRHAPRQESGRIQGLGGFFHPLDGVRGWNRLYGARGFLQYQLVVPFGEEATLRRVIERLSSGRCPSFLGVLKTFGPAGAGHLSFPCAGWTLALDVPVGPSMLGPLLDAVDGEVAGAGGRVYLAKDSRLRPELVEAMYPRLEEWRVVRDKVDPDRVLCSDLARRLGLLE
ncbi:MAG TPA: FAD-binding oxidoreductase [Acidimicrobiales bacterium]|nr:FAD-binding oxidoreductase [Acidimicrobiales bacterium]